VVSGVHRRYIRLNDPFVDGDACKTKTDRMQVPGPEREFARIARYGGSRRWAASTLERRVR